MASGCVAAKHLPQASLLLHVHEDEFSQGRRLEAEEVGRKLDVDQAIGLQHVLEDDVRRICVDDGLWYFSSAPTRPDSVFSTSRPSCLT